MISAIDEDEKPVKKPVYKTRKAATPKVQDEEKSSSPINQQDIDLQNHPKFAKFRSGEK
jgi:hypothetical protein